MYRNFLFMPSSIRIGAHCACKVRQGFKRQFLHVRNLINPLVKQVSVRWQVSLTQEKRHVESYK